uniref:2-hydroxyacyl-CoA lyase 2 n=1 Tax=Astyanax mexicanus TaxID=7994 RepID=A0A8B9JHJ0_ASTMX
KRKLIFVLSYHLMLTAGPGLTNTVTAVKNAQMAESPLLLIGGAAATLLQGRGALQDIDQMSLFKPLCKFCASVRSVREIVPTVRRALAVAQSGTPGPVFIEFPIDTLYPYHVVEKEFSPKIGFFFGLLCRKALESLGIPCFLGGMSRGMLGKNSPLHIRQNRRDALKEADLVLLAGTVCDFRLSYGRVLNRQSKIITVNRDKSQLLKNSDIFWKPTVAIQGDVGSFLLRISKGLEGHTFPQDWAENLKEGDKAKEKANRAKAEEKTERHLNPLSVLQRVDELMAEDSIIVADGGDFVGSAAYIMRPRGPLCWLDPGAFGTLGVGGGFALGAKLCHPDSEVWVVYGDGSLGYSVAEFDTFTRHKTPVIALVGNDACWSQISREQVPILGSNVACGLAFTDYHVVAQGYGGKGHLIGREDESQLEDIVKEAQRECKEGQAVLLNVLIGKTNFRDGSISV